MPVTLQCTRCMHEQKVDDDKLEKGVPCRICHNLIKQSAEAKTSAKSLADQGNKEEGVQAGPPSPKLDKQAVSTGRAPKPARDGDDEEETRSRSRRKSRGADDDDRPAPRKRPKEESSSGLMYILIGGGALLVLMVLCGGGGIGAFFLFSSDAPKNEPLAKNDRVPEPPPAFDPNPNPLVFNPPNNPFPNNPFPNNPNPFPNNPNPFQQPEQLDPNNPNNIDRVITLLKGPEQQRGPAYSWLKAANPEHPRRNEVVALLESNVKTYLAAPATFGNGGLFDAFFRWATKNSVPVLINVVEKTPFTVWDNAYRQNAMKLLGKMKDARGADCLAGKLGNAFDGEVANSALIEMGSVAEPALIKMFNARDGRDRVRALLKTYNTSSDKIITQCIADFEGQDKDRSNNALQYFMNTPIDAKQRPQVAAALVKKLNANAGNQFGSGDIIKALAKVPDPEGTKAIVRSMTNFFNQGPAKNALKEIGPTAEPFIVEAMNMAADNNARKVYVNTLGEMGTTQSVPALNQIAMRFLQDRGFVNDVQRAIKSIQARGK